MNYRCTTVVLTLCGALLPAAISRACPVPADADSAYHTLSRLAQRAPALGLSRPAPPLPGRDTGVAHPCVGGVAEGFPCNNVDLKSYLPLSSLGGGVANDIWGWTDSFDGSEYALVGKSNGTAFVNITDPLNPVYLGSLPTHTENSPWRDIKVFQDYAFIVSEAAGHGMQVFDLTQLRGLTTPLAHTETAFYGAFGAAHNIAINEQAGFAYVVGTRNIEDGCGGGLHMIDLSAPGAPQFAGCYAGDGYTHDAQCVIYSGPDTIYQGAEICFNYNEDTLTIVNVSNKSSPVQIARVAYAGSGYTHQGWLTEDQLFLLLDDEADELTFGHNSRTYIWDVSDLDNPEVVGDYLSSVPAIDHNLYIRGDFAFQANYRAGLRILDVSQIGSGVVTENGFFDVYPQSNGADFNGSWSVYPFFASGHVIVSGIEQGLFVLEPTALEPGFVLVNDTPGLAICADDSASMMVSIDPVGSYTGEVLLQASGAPPGVTLQFSPPSVNPPATTMLTATASGAAPGLYPLTLTATDGQIQFDQSLNLFLSEQQPGAAQLLLPADGAATVSGIQTLYWNADPGVFGYDLEVASDDGFASLVLAANDLQQRYFAPPAALPGATELHWRVRAYNACGSVLSETATFTTAGAQCGVYTSTDVPVPIPAVSTGTVVSNLVVDAPGVIVDVNVVNLQATHSWINDIDIRLDGPFMNSTRGQRHPDRPSVQIMNQSCNNEDNLDINFDDEAAAGAWPCPPVDGGYYQPVNPLAAFDGAAGSGEWNLLVTDNFPADGGSLDGWGLQICTAPAPLLLDLDADSIDDLVDNCTAVANADQRDTNGDGFGNACDADLDNDGVVNFVDLDLMKAAFFSSNSADSDLNGDNVTNFADLDIMKQSFFGSPGPSGIVP